MTESRMLIEHKPTWATGDGVDYETVWYCLRRGSKEHFPDGLPARRTKQRQGSTCKPIWIKLGEGDSWKDAITFGPAILEMERAAEDFGAIKIVWLEEKFDRPHSKVSQKTAKQ